MTPTKRKGTAAAAAAELRPAIFFVVLLLFPLALAAAFVIIPPPRPQRALFASGGRGGRSPPLKQPLPSDDELRQQKSESLSSLVSYHDGTWRSTGGATSFSITLDPASGIRRRKVGLPYQTSVSTRIGASNNNDGGGIGVKLQETYAWIDAKTNRTCVNVRGVDLGKTADVDSVDGSYSVDWRQRRTDMGRNPGDSDDSSDDEVPEETNNHHPLPSILVGGPKSGVDLDRVTFVAEHVVALSDTERSRMFLLYGDDDNHGDDNGFGDGNDVIGRLLRVILTDEVKVGKDATEAPMSNDGGGGTKKGSDDGKVVVQPRVDAARIERALIDEDEETARAIDRIVGRLTGESDGIGDDNDNDDSGGDGKSGLGLGPSLSMPSAVDDPISIETTTEERMERLQRALKRNGGGGKGEGGNDEGDGLVIEQQPMTLEGLSSGVWLGDAVLRERLAPHPIEGGASTSRPRRSGAKGFGGGASSASKRRRVAGGTSDSSSFGDGFAEWSIGVQKAAMRYVWDYGDILRHDIEWGRSLGVYTSTDMPRRSDAIVVANDGGSRLVDPRDRSAVLDFDGGGSVGILLGSKYIRAPRYMAFSRGSSPPFTEFAIFQSKRPSSLSQGGENVDRTSLKDRADNVLGYNSGNADNDAGSADVFEMICSRMTRLYDGHGGLMQGCTAFFSLRRMSSVEESDNMLP